MENGRRTHLDILYNNRSITTDIQPFIGDCTVTDNLSEEIDSIDITLSDIERKWIGSWMPQTGATLKATAILKDWEPGATTKRYLGLFEIDELSASSPPSKVVIRGLSVPESSSLRGEAKYKAWEKATLKKVADDIAKQNKLKLYFNSDENPEYERLDQAGEEDAKFLLKLCKDAGLALKITNNSIAIMDEAKLEAAKPVGTIKRTDLALNGIDGFDGRISMNGIYKSCRLEYTNSKKKNTIKYTYTPPKPPKTSRILVLNDQVESQSEAIRLTKKRLREANKDGTTMMIRKAGILGYYAGQTIMLSGFGGFDAKYIIKKMALQFGQKTMTTLELRKCLEGY